MTQYLLAAMIGLVGGITSGMFGVGGGVVMVPAMVLLLGIRDMKLAVGTSLAVIIPTALMGTIKHHGHGNVDWRTVALLTPTAVLGGYLGVKITAVVAAGDLKRAFGIFIIAVGIKLAFFK